MSGERNRKTVIVAHNALPDNVVKQVKEVLHKLEKSNAKYGTVEVTCFESEERRDAICRRLFNAGINYKCTKDQITCEVREPLRPEADTPTSVCDERFSFEYRA